MTELTTPKDHKIIVPVDFSESSQNALQYAVKMAKLFDNEIVLLYALNENRFASILTGSNTKELIKEGIKRNLESSKSAILALWPEARVKLEVIDGKPYKVIEQLTEEDKVDLVVMGTNGESGIERFIGSTTRRVMSSSNVPVVAVKNGKTTPTFERIVMPIDLTKTTKQKVMWAIKLAKKFNSTIHVISEVEKDTFLKNKLDKNLKQIEGILTEHGVKHITKLLDDKRYPDHIGKDTTQYADEIDADLIIIMTQQEGSGLSQMFIGNYAEQIVAGADKTPVMSINPRKTTRFEGSEGFY